MVKEPTSQAGGPRALQPSEGLPLPKAISAHKPWAHAALPRPGRQCAPLRLHSEAPLILPAPEDHPAMRQLTGISSDFWIPDLVPLRNHQPKVSILPGGSTFRVLSQSVLFITNIFTKEYKTCNIYFNSPRVSLSTNALFPKLCCLTGPWPPTQDQLAASSLGHGWLAAVLCFF